MTNPNSEKCALCEIDGGPLAHVWQIVDANQSYRLACTALSIGARSTDGREDYVVEPFNKALPLHARLPGAAHATADDYVFFAAMPLDDLSRFIAMMPKTSAPQAAI